jgi:hypothetical protein
MGDGPSAPRAFVFTIERREITAIELIMDPQHLAELDVRIG